MTRALRVYILSNDDLTSNVIFAPLFESEDVEVVGLAFSTTLLNRQPGGAATHALKLLRRTDFRYWGYQVFVNGTYKLRQAGGRSAGSFPSLRKLAATRDIPVVSTPNFSAPEFVQTLREKRPDLIVMRVNQLLSATVLDSAPHGVWCAHSSILPAYGGIAAELQGLAKGDDSVGTTIFRVSKELDAGEPLLQRRVAVESGASLYSAILANNRAAGTLLRQAIESLARSGTVEHDLVSPRPAASYFSWPTRRDVSRLRERGHRLMRLQDVARYLRSLLM